MQHGAAPLGNVNVIASSIGDQPRLKYGRLMERLQWRADQAHDAGHIGLMSDLLDAKAALSELKE